jgi:hypothetical protein
VECFITEITGIETLSPIERVYVDDEYPENWYKAI